MPKTMYRMGGRPKSFGRMFLEACLGAAIILIIVILYFGFVVPG